YQFRKLQDMPELFLLDHQFELTNELVSKENNDNGMLVDISKETYEAMESMDKLITIGAYDSGSLIGYLVSFIVNHPHYWYLSCATIMRWFTAVHYRGRGIGKQLLAVHEEWAKSRGIDYILLGQRTHLEYPSLPSGYKELERTYIKWL